MANFEDLILRDTRANQPAAGVAGRLYYVTDENVLERDNGSSWDNIGEISGGAGSDTTAIHTDVDSEIAGLTEETTPASGDWFLLEKSTGEKRKVDRDNLPGGSGDGPAWVSRLAAAIDSPNADSDEFSDDTISGWTAVTPTGTATWTEKRGLLSCLSYGSSANDACCQLKAMASATAPKTIETVVRMLSGDENWAMIGLMFSDGVLATSNAIVLMLYNGGTSTTCDLWSGTITNIATTVGAILVPPDRGFVVNPFMHMRLIWSAANNFKVQLSPDGVSWTDFAFGTKTVTLTPTHYGIFVSKWGGSQRMIGTFEYFRAYDADKSV